MRPLPLTLAATLALAIAACSQDDGNVSLAEANASGEAASNAIDNAIAAAPGAPLERAAALKLMKERHDNYEKIGDAMKIASRELKADSPNLDKVRQSADLIADLAPRAASWFPAGTGPDVGKTDAKAEIWAKPEDFKAKADSFTRAAQAFQAAARGSDLGAIRAAHGELGKSCKACHELYRTEH